MPDPTSPTAGHVVDVPGLGRVAWIPTAAGTAVRVVARTADVRAADARTADARMADARTGAVAYCDAAEEIPALGRALEAAPDDVAGLVTASPVVDALKRVDGDRVLHTVDRSALRRPTAPAILRPRPPSGPIAAGCDPAPRFSDLRTALRNDG